MRIRVYRHGDEAAVSALAAAALYPAQADGKLPKNPGIASHYSANGRLLFQLYIAPDAIMRRQCDDAQTLVATDDDGILTGVLELRKFTHISMFFVTPHLRGRGIGRALLAKAERIARCATGEKVAFTVFAAPGSEEAYRKLGFAAAGEQQNIDGVIFTPMHRGK